MRYKDLILREVGNAAKESPRSGIIPDLADVLMIEVLIDIRDILELRLCQAVARIAEISHKD